MIMRKGHLPSAQCVPSMAGLEDYQLIQGQPQGVRGSVCAWRGEGVILSILQMRKLSSEKPKSPTTKDQAAAHRVCLIPQPRGDLIRASISPSKKGGLDEGEPPSGAPEVWLQS